MNARSCWLTITISLAVGLLGLAPEPVCEALQFDRTALARGELWRLLTGHLVHWGASHLGWDLLVFVALGAWCETRVDASGRAKAGFVGLLLVSAAAISAGVWLVQPRLGYYRGLSGLDSALFAVAAMTMLRDQWSLGRRGVAGLIGVVALAFFAKIAWEFSGFGAVFVRDAAMMPVPLAHAIGGAAGLLFYVFNPADWRGVERRSRRRGSN